MSLSLSQCGSFFQAVAAREVLASRVFHRPNVRGMISNGEICGCGVLELKNNGVNVPPLAITFGKGHDNGHLLAVADEEGFLSIFNAREHLPSLADCHRETENVRIGRLLAHNNAVFDICWLQDGVHMLTASGDQTIKLWDMNLLKEKGTMMGHNGSVKSVSMHPFHERQFISGSRDGNVAIWDLRSQDSSTNLGIESSFRPVAWIKDAHVPSRRRKQHSHKSTTKSVTAVVYLKDGQLLASAGAADGKLKFWDIRNVKMPVHQILPGEARFQNGAKGRRAHGIASLSQDPSGTHLIASSTDNKIYMYHLAQPKDPLKIFSGHMVGSFYVKAVFSPDGTHILSGSTDGKVFVWQVDGPAEDSPAILQGHASEVTAVDWCPTDFCKVATCSDDHMLCFHVRSISPAPS
ncbi:hypothetical protein O6H91_16G038300 [Diphasiastrum complanatum]|uniref:Uncharacterized protein n=1 Tax=Diphasiastrum complanatum TaxID=34168 RepID=A0ACC2BCJ0_DIPCM|nr:hypothetical protein O6H91_16G038300 [Diphasiastrum complanatum]